MPAWSDEAKERNEEIKRVRIDEAAEALINVLIDMGAESDGNTVLKGVVFERIRAKVNQLRSVNGYLEEPTVENRAVKPANAAFCRCNWRDIRRATEQYGYYVLWAQEGERPGIRLGTLKEFEAQQSQVRRVAEGFTDFHNERADILEKHGREAPKLTLRLRRTPEES
jgi:hypothetical protein